MKKNSPPESLLRLYGDQFRNHLRRLVDAGADGAVLDHAQARESLLYTIEHADFTANDLNFITVMVVALSQTHPAALYAQLRCDVPDADCAPVAPTPPAA